MVPGRPRPPGRGARRHEVGPPPGPVSPLVNNGIAAILFYAGRRQEAIAHLRETIELDPGLAVSHYGLGRTYLHDGDPEASIAELQKALSIAPDSPGVIADLAHAYAVAGRRSEALAAMRKWEASTRGAFTRPEQLAHIHAALGDRDRAIALLQEAYEKRSPGLVWLKVDPRFDSLRSDERFQELLRKVGA